jgi:tetratricopeptide (TPR) repeat protein
VNALHRFATPRRLALGISLLAVVPFLPSLGGDFIFDDMLQIVENDQIRDLRNLPRFFTADVWAAAGIPYSAFYRPLMYTTFAFETALTGGEPQPWVFRVTNLLLHASVCLALFATMRRVGAPLAAAALAGALFAVHPMHAEDVAWASARPDLLMTLFALLASLVYLGAPAPAGPSRARFLAVGGLMMLSLLSKESGVAAPVLLGALVMMRSPAEGGLARIREGLFAALPYVALIAVFLGLRGMIIQVEGMPPLVGDDVARFPFRSWSDAIATVVAIAGRYLALMLVPFEASFFRVPRWDYVAWGLWAVPLGLAAVAGAPWNRAAAWLAFAFLSIGVQSIGIPSAGYLSQRYAYLPSAGACAAIAEALAWAFFGAAASAARVRVGLAASAALIAAWMALLVPRSLEWTDEDLLWRAAWSRDTDSTAVVMNYAFRLVDHGRAGEALPLFRSLEALEPGSWVSPYGQANALAALRRYDEAIVLYREAVERAPMVPQIRQSLAAVYEETGDFEAARQVYAEAADLHADSSLSQGMLGTALAKAGDDEEALARIDEALRIRPDRPELLLNRVIVLVRLGRIDEAIAESEQMLDTPLLAPEAHYNLGIIYDRHRPDPARAIEHYETALRLLPNRHNAAVVRNRVHELREATGRAG